MTFLLKQARKDFEAARQYSHRLTTAREHEVEQWQWEKLQRVWDDAVRNVPYYRALVRNGLAPERLRNWQDFSRIPILQRSTLQLRQNEFERDSSPDEIRMTGGSTGVPVHLGVWRREAGAQRVAKLILWQRMGYDPSKRLFLIWGHLHLLGTGLRGKANHLLRKMKDSLLKYRRVDAYSLSPSKCHAIAKNILKFKPFGLIGYASALDYFVRSTDPFHEAFGKLGLGFVMPAGEMLPRMDSYDLLRQVFKCPVVEEYAGVEFGQVAMKQNKGLFQVFHDLNYVETRSEPGRNDQLLVTSLTERYAPLIRYAPGDEISGARHFGHGHIPEFEKVIGRVHDEIQLPGGQMLHSMGVLHCIHQEPAVLGIQMVLRDEGPRLRLAVSNTYDRSCESRIRERFGQLSPELRAIPIDVVSDVTATTAGKRRWIHDERTPSKAARLTL